MVSFHRGDLFLSAELDQPRRGQNNLAFQSQLRVLHRTDNFLVVDKAPDLIINSDDPDRPSVYKEIATAFPELVDDSYKYGFRTLHRLDYSTSGVLVVPLTAKSCRAAAKALNKGRMRKYYVALLRGHVATNYLRISQAIGEDARPEWKGIKMATSDKGYCENARDAETKLIVLSRGIFEGYPATKVLLQPITGRRHQLRIHCEVLGHRIIGDYTYSNRRDDTPSRMYLHALRLVLCNPVEDLDNRTSDPFPSSNEIGCEGYAEEENLHLLENEDTFRLFHALPEKQWLQV